MPISTEFYATLDMLLFSPYICTYLKECSSVSSFRLPRLTTGVETLVNILVRSATFLESRTGQIEFWTTFDFSLGLPMKTYILVLSYLSNFFGNGSDLVCAGGAHFQVCYSKVYR